MIIRQREIKPLDLTTLFYVLPQLQQVECAENLQVVPPHHFLWVTGRYRVMLSYFGDGGTENNMAAFRFSIKH